MPLTYGGGVRSIDDMKQIFGLGVEKIAVNSCVHENPTLIREAAEIFGSQSIVGSIDVKTNKNASKLTDHSKTNRAFSLAPYI